MRSIISWFSILRIDKMMKITVPVILTRFISVFFIFLVQCTTYNNADELKLVGTPFESAKISKDLLDLNQTLLVSNSPNSGYNFNGELKLVRTPFENPKISKHLLDLNQTLLVPTHKKDPTHYEASWIDKFLVSLKNWFDLLTAVQRSPKYRNKIRAREQNEFSGWITGGYSYYFKMTYKLPENPKMGQIWNIVIYAIAADGLYMAKLVLNKAEVEFEMSKNKLPLADGTGFDYRKDRTYRIAVTANVASSLVKIQHEIVQAGEQPQYQYYAKDDERTVKAKPGFLRFILYDVKIYIQVVLTEIDKRFVVPNRKDKIKYYFQLPTIEDIRITIGTLEPYTTTYQVKEGYSDVNIDPECLTEQQRINLKQSLIGANLNVAKADRILADFITVISSKDNGEFVSRLRVALINKFAKAIMTSPDITTVREQVKTECFSFNASFPRNYDATAISNYRRYFFMSYSYQSLLETMIHIIETSNADPNSNQSDVNEDLLLQQQAAAADAIIRDNGFDYNENLEIANAEYQRQFNQSQMGPSKEKSTAKVERSGSTRSDDR